MKAGKGTLTLKDLEKCYREAQKFEVFPCFLVSSFLAQKIDKLWDKLPWFVKIEINLNRLIHGMGFYRKSGGN